MGKESRAGHERSGLCPGVEGEPAQDIREDNRWRLVLHDHGAAHPRVEQVNICHRPHIRECNREGPSRIKLGLTLNFERQEYDAVSDVVEIQPLHCVVHTDHHDKGSRLKSE